MFRRLQYIDLKASAVVFQANIRLQRFYGLFIGSYPKKCVTVCVYYIKIFQYIFFLDIIYHSIHAHTEVNYNITNSSYISFNNAHNMHIGALK